MIRIYHCRKRIIGAAVALSALLAMGIGTANAQDAATLYAGKCAACHGAAGKGDGPAAKILKPPPADFAVALQGKSDDWIAKAITEGGKGVGQSPLMPAYATFSPDQIKSLVAFVKQFHAK